MPIFCPFQHSVLAPPPDYSLHQQDAVCSCAARYHLPVLAATYRTGQWIAMLASDVDMHPLSDAQGCRYTSFPYPLGSSRPLLCSGPCLSLSLFFLSFALRTPRKRATKTRGWPSAHPYLCCGLQSKIQPIRPTNPRGDDKALGDCKPPPGPSLLAIHGSRCT